MATASDRVGESDTQLPIGRRAAARARLQANGTLETTTGATPVVIRNLSCTGAMLEGNDLPKVNRAAILQRGDIDVMGVVIWSEGDRCGFHFFDPISEELVISEARKRPETMPSAHVAIDLSAGVSEQISVDDWRTMKARSEHPYRPFRGFS